MIIGAVMGNGDPVIQISVRDAGGQDVPINFILDTGYTGYLALPPRWVNRLQWTPTGVTLMRFADNSEAQTTTYDEIILWDGMERIVTIAELDGDPLIGTDLLYDHEVIIQFINGGRVTVTRLP